MSEEDKDDKLLKKISLFSALTDEQFAAVKQKMRVVNLKKNTTIFDTETIAERFFVLTSGQVKLYRISQGGMEKIVQIIRAGETFASAVIFMESKTYPVCADALRTSRILSFDNQHYLNILRESHETCFRMLAHMSQQLRWQLTEIDQLSLQSAPSRLVNFLLENMKSSGDNMGVTRLDAPKRIIASRLTIQPETFSRLLNKLSSLELITVEGQSIKINDVEALTKFYTISSK
ncbi:MAG: Crp/Fnr family transcriptional regulator [Magnetococcales bacterium]|nr:Crp/Fnr family transcriptional regulator [Magnetococcales bacterium]MBF0584250.1 Crp/Fnr family transcriptional regulator [Magnetococcales bacterium]